MAPWRFSPLLSTQKPSSDLGVLAVGSRGACERVAKIARRPWACCKDRKTVRGRLQRSQDRPEPAAKIARPSGSLLQRSQDGPGPVAKSARRPWASCKDRKTLPGMLPPAARHARPPDRHRQDTRARHVAAGPAPRARVSYANRSPRPEHKPSSPITSLRASAGAGSRVRFVHGPRRSPRTGPSAAPLRA